MGQSDEGWDELEQFVAEISGLSQTDTTLDQYAGVVLEKTVGMLDAEAGAVWVMGPDAELKLQRQIDSKNVMASGDLLSAPEHTRFLQSVIHSAEPQQLAMSGYLWMAAPFQMDREIVGVIEIVADGAAGSAAHAGSGRLLGMVCDLAGDFLRRQQLREFQQSTEQWQRYEALVQRVGSTLDLRDAAYQLVNDGRLFVGCDRVSLIVPRKGQLRVIAISGVDSPERQSPLVAAMESLAEAVATGGQWLRYRSEIHHDLPPQLEQPLAQFCDQSHSQTIDVVPLLAAESDSAGDETLGQEKSTDETLVGVLVLERFDASADHATNEERIIRVANLGSLVMRNALHYHSLPLLSVSQFLGSLSRLSSGRRWLAYAGAAAVVLIALTTIRIPFRVSTQGELQPTERREIYATQDGEVVEVQVEHDQSVTPGQELVVLKNRALDLDFQRLEGEYQTAEKKLLAIASARVQINRATDSPQRYPGQLAAEEQELKQQLASLTRQLDLIRKQRDQLLVRSPIGGTVLTWNPRQQLEDRPVSRGQRLLSVARLQGAWHLELAVPDSRIGYLLSAQDDQDDLEVTFALATARSQTYRGRVREVSRRTEVVDGQPSAAKVLVDFEDVPDDVKLPGATVYAKIHCGKRSVAYVWLHDLYETVRTWMLF